MNAIPQRLIAARKAAGLSQEEAAAHLNLSRPTFIAIEKGARPIKPEELIALAAAYKESVNRLVREDRPPPTITPHLRVDTRDARDDAGLEEAIHKLTGFVDDYMFLQEVTGAAAAPTPPPQPHKQSMTLEKFAEHCAQEQRKLLGFGDREPIVSLRKTLDEIGVHVFSDAFNSKLAGLYSYVEGFGYCILVNSKHPKVRRRWTIAHEYGHFLFDRDKPGVDFLKPPERKPENERFADLFAAHFLMPTNGLERRFHDAYAEKNDVNIGDVLRISNYYCVSLTAMMLRLESIGLIRKGSWDEIRRSNVRVRDIRAEANLPEPKEPEPLEIFPERYIMLAISAWSSEKITTSQFAKLLRKSVVDARQFASAHSSQKDDLGTSIELVLSQSVVHRSRPSA